MRRAGGIANKDGSPTPLYDPLRVSNHDFVEIARELQPLQSLGVYHAGMMPSGAQALPAQSVFAFDPPVPAMEYKPPRPLEGALIGIFGKPSKRSSPTHALIVNLDYRSARKVGIRVPKKLEMFNPSTREWSRANQRHIELDLTPGAGTLVRIQQ